MVKMETETLNSYEQVQDKHVLDDSMDINIPRNDERSSEIHQDKEINTVNSELWLKDGISDNTESRKGNCESSENKENESDCDQLITNSEENHVENETKYDKISDTDCKKETEMETIESEEVNCTEEKLNDECINNTLDENSHSDDSEPQNEKEKDPSNKKEEDPSNEKEKDPSNEKEKDPLNEKEKDPSNEIEKDPSNENQCISDTEQNNVKNVLDIDNQKDPHDSIPNYLEKTDNEVITDKEANQNKNDDIENNEDTVNSNNSEAENKDNSEKDEIQEKSIDCPLLKETLTKPSINKQSDDSEQQKEAEVEDIDMDDDFDPSLLCPDIAMEVDEAPVITSNDIPPSDGNKSPSLYEPIFSTYVDEMTGAEVSFNLTAEEQQLRQETFGEENPVQYSKVHCTACNVHLGSALDGQSNRFVHPLLKVLICKDCYHFYTSGEFEKDEDGSELYCRWCGQGGQVICCSSCEMVFCKKCIRINFGRRKLTEIRDSDEWLCFRCNPLQLTALRIHCAEFMEYVRREISRAATLENATSFTTTDYTQCCLVQKKKYVDPHPSEPKKKKRKTSNDPDYDPVRDRSLSPQPSTSTAAAVEAPPQKLVPILPKLTDAKENAGIVTESAKNNSVFRVGNTTFRPKLSQFSQPRPRVQVINPINPSVRPPSSGPGYIKIMPGGIRVSPNVTRNQSPQSFISPNTRQPSFQHKPMRPAGNYNNQMKHEWFEKTVRAAARVNSNLSYTLTQLNRAQANATSVEALAVVHNKLQEILSTSINSLIQIRKNLRTEFIAGIKNIRFPSKQQPQPSTSAQDDDVIFVSPTPSPVPPSILPTTSSNCVPPLTSVNLPSVSLTKRTSQSPGATPSTGPSTDNEKPKGFLRVKSLTALQNVPAECITIPDDPLPSPPPLTPIQKHPKIMVIDNSPEKINETNDKNVEVMDIASTAKEVSETSIEKSQENGKQLTTDHGANGDKSEDKNLDMVERNNIVKQENELSESDGNSNKAQDDSSLAFDVKDTSSLELKKINDMKILITRSEEVDTMVKQFFGLVNGDTSE